MWKPHFFSGIFLALTLLFPNPFSGITAVADSKNDYAGKTTPACQLQGLDVKPPSGWINVPVDTADKPIKGCQMMLIEDETYLGIIRLFSHDTSNIGDRNTREWESYLVEFETLLLAEMGFKRENVLWKRDTMPVSGEGFYGGKATGFKISIENFDVPWEAHFVVFQSDRYLYLISLVSPSESAGDGGDLYRENTAAMGFVMRTMQPGSLI